MSNFCGGFDSYSGFGGGRGQPVRSTWSGTGGDIQDQEPKSARTAIKNLSPHQPNTVRGKSTCMHYHEVVGLVIA